MITGGRDRKTGNERRWQAKARRLGNDNVQENPGCQSRRDSGARDAGLPRDGHWEVARDQGLLVIEAMKMQNELRTPRAGRAAELHVQEGMETGSKLLRLE